MHRPRHPASIRIKVREPLCASGPQQATAGAESFLRVSPAWQPMSTPGLSGPSADLWLLCCALVGVAFWLLSARIDAPNPTAVGGSVDLAIGHGLPMLALELGLASQGVSYVDDVEDVSRAIESGLARVGIDAGPAGVRIVHRPEGIRGGVPVLVQRLRQTWPEASTQVIASPWSPQRLAPLLLVLLLVNAGALVLLRQLQHLQRGAWLRWLALQGAGVPGLLVSVFVRHAWLTGWLGLFACAGLLGFGDTVTLLPLIVLLALLSVWFGALLAVAARWRAWLWLSVQGLIVTVWILDPGPAGYSTASTMAGLLGVLLACLMLSSVMLRDRLLAGYRGGEA